MLAKTTNPFMRTLEPLRMLGTGRADGSVRTSEMIAERFKALTQQVPEGQQMLFPWLQMSNRVALVDHKALQGGQYAPHVGAQTIPIAGFVRHVGQEPCDGVIVGRGVAVGICNADCPVLVGTTVCEQYMVVLHLGLRTMLRAGDDEGTPSIIESLGQQLRMQGLALDRAWFGFGARACCFGYDDGWPYLSDLRQRFPDAVVGRVLRGKRVGNHAVDMGHLAQHLAAQHLEAQLEIDPYCTSCGGRDISAAEPGPHFSVAQGDGLCRNFFAAFWA